MNKMSPRELHEFRRAVNYRGWPDIMTFSESIIATYGDDFKGTDEYRCYVELFIYLRCSWF